MKRAILLAVLFSLISIVSAAVPETSNCTVQNLFTGEIGNQTIPLNVSLGDPLQFNCTITGDDLYYWGILFNDGGTMDTGAYIIDGPGYWNITDIIFYYDGDQGEWNWTPHATDTSYNTYNYFGGTLEVTGDEPPAPSMDNCTAQNLDTGEMVSSTHNMTVYISLNQTVEFNCTLQTEPYGTNYWVIELYDGHSIYFISDTPTDGMNSMRAVFNDSYYVGDYQWDSWLENDYDYGEWPPKFVDSGWIFANGTMPAPPNMTQCIIQNLRTGEVAEHSNLTAYVDDPLQINYTVIPGDLAVDTVMITLWHQDPFRDDYQWTYWYPPILNNSINTSLPDTGTWQLDCDSWDVASTHSQINDIYITAESTSTTTSTTTTSTTTTLPVIISDLINTPSVLYEGGVFQTNATCTFNGHTPGNIYWEIYRVGGGHLGGTNQAAIEGINSANIDTGFYGMTGWGNYSILTTCGFSGGGPPWGSAQNTSYVEILASTTTTTTTITTTTIPYVPTGPEDWVTYHHDNYYTGYTNVSLNFPLELKWQNRVEKYGTDNVPLIVGNYVYIIGGDRWNFTKIDLTTGNTTWTATLSGHGTWDQSPAYADGKLVLSDDTNGNIYVIDDSTGNQICNTSSENNLLSQTIIPSLGIFIGAGNYTNIGGKWYQGYVAYKLSDCSRQWEFQCGQTWHNGGEIGWNRPQGPAFDGSNLYLMCAEFNGSLDKDMLYKVDASTGTQVWSWTDTKPDCWDFVMPDFDSAVVNIKDGLVYVPAWSGWTILCPYPKPTPQWNNYIYAIDMNTGITQWNTSMQFDTGTPVLGNNLLCHLNLGTESIDCLNPVTGAYQWSITPGSSSDQITNLVMGNGFICNYFGSTRYNIACWNTSSQALLWESPAVAAETGAEPAIYSKGIIFGDWNGNIYNFGETTTTTTTTTTTSTTISTTTTTSTTTTITGTTSTTLKQGTCYDGIKNCHDGDCEEDVDFCGPCWCGRPMTIVLKEEKKNTPCGEGEFTFGNNQCCPVGDYVVDGICRKCPPGSIQVGGSCVPATYLLLGSAAILLFVIIFI
jgi:outer membrane protein assembly factor BamB